MATDAIISLKLKLEQILGAKEAEKALGLIKDDLVKTGKTGKDSFKLIDSTVKDMKKGLVQYHFQLQQTLSLLDRLRGKQATTKNVGGYINLGSYQRQQRYAAGSRVQDVWQPGQQSWSTGPTGWRNRGGQPIPGKFETVRTGKKAGVFQDYTQFTGPDAAKLKAGDVAMKASGKTVDGLNKSHQGLIGTIGQMTKKAVTIVPIWMGIRLLYQSVFGTIRDGMKYLIEWETAMSQIEVVGNGSKGALKSLSEGLMQVGISTGLSTQNLAEGARLWAQQGKAYSDIIPLMKTTAKLSIVTGRSVSDSVEDITSIMISFGIAASDTGRIVDSLVAIDLKYAITTDVLVAALKKVGPVAAQMGISMEKMEGIITATHLSTRAAGEEIGNSWRTILTRIGTTAKETIQNLADVAIYTTEAGEATTKQTGNFRSWSDILDEVALGYGNLSEEMQLQLAVKIAGIRQISKLVAAMRQWKDGMNATEAAQLSAGKGQIAANILMDTTEVKLKKLGNAWFAVLNSFENSDVFKNFLDEMIKGFETLSIIISNVYGNSNRLLQQQIDLQDEADSRRLNGMEAYLSQITKRAKIEAEIAKNIKSGNLDANIELEKDLAESRRILADEGAGYEGTTEVGLLQERVASNLKLVKLKLASEYNSLWRDIAETTDNSVGETLQRNIKTHGTVLASEIDKINQKIKTLDFGGDNKIAGFFSGAGIGQNVLTQYIDQLVEMISLLEKFKTVNEAIAKIDAFKVPKQDWQDWLGPFFTTLKLYKEITRYGKVFDATQQNLAIKAEEWEAITAKTVVDLKAMGASEELLLEITNKKKLAFADIVKLREWETELSKVAASNDKEALKAVLARVNVKPPEENFDNLSDAVLNKRVADIQNQALLGTQDLVIQEQLLNFYLTKALNNNKKITLEVIAQQKLAVEKAKLQKSYNDFLKDEETTVKRLEGLGYSKLNIALKEYDTLKKYLISQNQDIENNDKLIDQHREILGLIQDQVSEASGKLQNSFADSLSEVLGGDSTFGELGDNLTKVVKKGLLDAAAGNIAEKLFTATGIGSKYGEMVAQIRNYPINVQKALVEAGKVNRGLFLEAFEKGGALAANTILDSHVKGAEAIKNVLENSEVICQCTCADACKDTARGGKSGYTGISSGDAYGQEERFDPFTGKPVSSRSEARITGLGQEGTLKTHDAELAKTIIDTTDYSSLVQGELTQSVIINQNYNTDRTIDAIEKSAYTGGGFVQGTGLAGGVGGAALSLIQSLTQKAQPTGVGETQAGQETGKKNWLQGIAGWISGAIPNEITKTNSASQWTQYIPIIGPYISALQKGVSAVDNFAETYEQGGNWQDSLTHAMTAIQGQAADPNYYSEKNQPGFSDDWLLNAGKILNYANMAYGGYQGLSAMGSSGGALGAGTYVDPNDLPRGAGIGINTNLYGNFSDQLTTPAGGTDAYNYGIQYGSSYVDGVQTGMAQGGGGNFSGASSSSNFLNALFSTNRSGTVGSKLGQNYGDNYMASLTSSMGNTSGGNYFVNPITGTSTGNSFSYTSPQGSYSIDAPKQSWYSGFTNIQNAAAAGVQQAVAGKTSQYLNAGGGGANAGGNTGASGFSNILAAAGTASVAYNNAGGGSRGALAAGLGGVGSLLMASPTGYGQLIGGILVVASLMMQDRSDKKQQQEETKTELQNIATKIEVTNKSLAVVNRNLVTLKNEKAYILPESAYFSSKSNLEDEFSVHSLRGVAF